jgi:hypothetical protein
LSRFPTHLALLAVLWSPAVAATTPLARAVIVVDGVSLAPKVPQAHERMRTHLEAALARENWALVRVAGADDCDPTCEARLVDETGAKYLLRLTGDRNQDDGYDVVVNLVRPARGSTRITKAYCDYCTIERMADVVGRTATQMLASAASEEPPEPKIVSDPQLPQQETPVPPSPGPEPNPALATPGPQPPTGYGWLPWTLIGVGAIAAGYGAWALHEDGKATGTCSLARTTTCERYDSEGIGIVALAGGGLLAVTGLVWEIVRLTRGPEIAFSPNSVSLTARF